jgi:hypothetical protein
MKKCYTCEALLPLEAFAPSVARGRKDGFCKACRRDYNKIYYGKHKATVNRNRYLNGIRYRTRNRKGLLSYLRQHPCVDCREADTRVLEFDHVRGKKENNISNLVREGWSWQRILSEIAKCEVRCANCHRRKTAEQFGWAHAIGA